jgi:hypothetical protein
MSLRELLKKNYENGESRRALNAALCRPSELAAAPNSELSLSKTCPF